MIKLNWQMFALPILQGSAHRTHRRGRRPRRPLCCIEKGTAIQIVRAAQRRNFTIKMIITTNTSASPNIMIKSQPSTITATATATVLMTSVRIRVINNSVFIASFPLYLAIFTLLSLFIVEPRLTEVSRGSI